jgi:hypothetical protein
MSLEGFKGAEELVYGRGEFPVRSIAVGWCKILPKNRVIDVASKVEGKILLKLVYPGEIVLGACFLELI